MEESTIINPEKSNDVECKIKRKMSTSSSLETVVIRSRFNDTIINQIIDMLAEWGGKIQINSFDSIFTKYNNFKIVDTCTIDNFLFAMSYSVQLNEKLWEYYIKKSSINQHLSSKIDQIIHLVLKKDWNSAKTIWILEVLELDRKRCRFSTFGEEFNFFIKYVNRFQRLSSWCSICSNIFYSSDEIYFEYDKI